MWCLERQPWYLEDSKHFTGHPPSRHRRCALVQGISSKQWIPTLSLCYNVRLVFLHHQTSPVLMDPTDTTIPWLCWRVLYLPQLSQHFPAFVQKLSEPSHSQKDIPGMEYTQASMETLPEVTPQQLRLLQGTTPSRKAVPIPSNRASPASKSSKTGIPASQGNLPSDIPSSCVNLIIHG